MNEMKSHGEDAFPNECCGFFYGEENDGFRVVTLAKRIENVKEGDQRRRFEISGKDYLKAERYAAKEGLTLLGIYHSHPVHPAIPSEHDLAVAMPWFSYLIVSVEPEGVDHVRSWQLTTDREFEEETIK
jgi:proteasome lid subunit RPN8/RPN11